MLTAEQRREAAAYLCVAELACASPGVVADVADRVMHYCRHLYAPATSTTKADLIAWLVATQRVIAVTAYAERDGLAIDG